MLAGDIIGASVSAFFLLLIAAINFFIFVEVFKRFQAARKGRLHEENALDDVLDGHGLISRILRSLFRFVGRSWQMYPIGLLFGLGFDTATEVALLGIAATQAARADADLVDHDLSAAVHLGHVPGHDRRRRHAPGLRLGVRRPGAEVVLQHDHHRRLLHDRPADRRHQSMSIIASKLHLDSGVFAGVNVISKHASEVGYERHRPDGRQAG